MDEIEPLFPKIEKELMTTPAPSVVEPKTKESPKIKIDEFKKCVIKTGLVLECENVKGSEKLLKFKVDIGEDEPRQILSGIAKFYNLSDLIGKKICVLANLKDAKIFGHLSQGMILTAEDSDGSLSLIAPTWDVKNGAIIG